MQSAEHVGCGPTNLGIGICEGLLQDRNGLLSIAFGKQSQFSMKVVVERVVHGPIGCLTRFPRKPMLGDGLVKLKILLRTVGLEEGFDMRCRSLGAPAGKHTVVGRRAGKKNAWCNGRRYFMEIKRELSVIRLVERLQRRHVLGKCPGLESALFRFVIREWCPATAGDGNLDPLVEGRQKHGIVSAQ